jgi:hypothetical protein
MKPLTDEWKRRRDENDGELGKKLIQVAIDKALKGDFRYYQELMNRSDGKVQEMLDVTTNGESMNQGNNLSTKSLDAIAEIEGGPGE